MRKYGTLFLAVVLAALALASLVLLDVYQRQSAAEEAAMLEAIYLADRARTVELETPVNIDIDEMDDMGEVQPDTVPEQQAEEEAYSELLEDAYSEDSHWREFYEEQKTLVIDGVTDAVGAAQFIDYGVFEAEILSKTIEGDRATVVIDMTIWLKSISHDSENIYRAVFPVNQETREVDLAKEDGVWKIVAYDSISPVLMEGDYELEKDFATFGEAVAYADQATPRNVFE